MTFRLIVALLMFLPGPALAWGPAGHAVVAHIAAHALNPRARGEVGRLLDGAAETMMVLESSWADEVRGDRPQTASWHYVNVELDRAGYDAARDCPHGDCVVAQVSRNAAILTSRAPDPAKSEALKYLIHFAADLHQPLHVADDDDRGGNLRLMRYRGKRVSLHHLWDDDVVAVLGRDPARVAGAIEASFTPQQRAAFAGGRPEQWAGESFAAARGIYGQLRGNGLPGDYAARQRDLTRTQLEKAGLRLAALLNAAFR